MSSRTIFVDARNAEDSAPSLLVYFNECGPPAVKHKHRTACTMPRPLKEAWLSTNCPQDTSQINCSGFVTIILLASYHPENGSRTANIEQQQEKKTKNKKVSKKEKRRLCLVMIISLVLSGAHCGGTAVTIRSYEQCKRTRIERRHTLKSSGLRECR